MCKTQELVQIRGQKSNLHVCHDYKGSVKLNRCLGISNTLGLAEQKCEGVGGGSNFVIPATVNPG